MVTVVAFLEVPNDGPSDHTQPSRMPRQGLHVKQLPVGVQGRPD